MAADPDLLPLNQARRRIPAAAMKLFAERGVTKVNISELAAAAGMARGTIYSHVPDMERLFDARVHLTLWVRVRRGWAQSEARLRSYGYE